MADETAGVLAAKGQEDVTLPAEEIRSYLADGTDALHEHGDLRASRPHFERAYQRAEQAGDVRAMTHAALGSAGLWVSESRTLMGAARREERLRHVLSLLDTGNAGQARDPRHADSVLARRIRVRLAAESDYSRGDSTAILALLGELGQNADPVLLAETLSLAHHCLLGPDHVALRGELAQRLIRTSVRTDRRSDVLMGLLWRTVDAYTEGEPHAERLLSELRGHLEPRGHLAVGFVVSAIDVLLAVRAGQLEQAETLVEICAKMGAEAGDIDNEWWPGAQLVTIRWYQGRLVELLPMLRTRVQSPALSAVDNSALTALAVAAALDGDRRTAASSLAALCGSDLGNLARSSSWLVTMNGIVEAASLLGDADVAARAYELLLPHARLPMVGSLGITCFGSTQHALGVASLACGEHDRAVEHLRDAVRHNLALAHWPAVIVSRQRLALGYAARGWRGDADAARRELDAAASEAAPLRLDLAAVGAGRAVAACAKAGAKRSASAARGAVAGCERQGRKWRFTLDGRSVLVEDSIGMTHLAVLVANPRQDISAADLAAGMGTLASAVSAATAVSAAGDTGAAHPVLDREAIARYRARVVELDDRVAQFDTVGDPAAAETARAERDWLTAQLASAAGLRGRTRSFADEPERARVAVGKAIRRALARISEADEPIGEHLRQAVHTGARCSYWPA
jgi:hypothetical protein